MLFLKENMCATRMVRHQRVKGDTKKINPIFEERVYQILFLTALQGLAALVNSIKIILHAWKQLSPIQT